MTTQINTPSDLWALVRSVRFVLLTHSDAAGVISSRPMTIQRIDEPGALWFFASRSSPGTATLAQRPNVSVGVADPGNDLYVSMTGTARIVRDREVVRALWTPMAGAWFANGVDDPELVAIEVFVEHVEYWNVQESKMVQLFKLAKAAITGTPPAKLGEHGTMDVHGTSIVHA
jgi:general stress protein 26